MKKLLSIALATIIALSVLIMPATSVSAKKTKKVPKTYIANLYDYYTKKGRVYKKPYKSNNYLYFTNKKGKTIRLSKRIEIRHFYVRGDTVYFEKGDRLFTVDLKGKEKKTKVDNVSTLYGGYGSAVIYRAFACIEKYKDGKVTTLYKMKGEYIDENPKDSYLFNGKVYIWEDKKVCDIATGKVKDFNSSQIVCTKNYLYYINKKHNLRRIDKQGNNKLVAKDVEKIIGVNDGATVAFTKKNSKGVQVLYRRTTLKRDKIRLCTYDDIQKVAIPDQSGYNRIDKGCFENGKLYLLVNGNGIITVNINGGAPKLICGITNDYSIYVLEYDRYGKVRYYERAEPCD